MNRTVVFAFAVFAVLLAPHSASAARYYGFTVGVSDAPPPPVIRMVSEPHAFRATDAMVYVVDDEALRFDGDLFRYGQYWFAYFHGYWYRARSHRGPYTVLDVRKVPRAIIGVPRKMWKHHPLITAPGRASASGAATRAQPVKPMGSPGSTRRTPSTGSIGVDSPPPPQ